MPPPAPSPPTPQYRLASVRVCLCVFRGLWGRFWGFGVYKRNKKKKKNTEKQEWCHKARRSLISARIICNFLTGEKKTPLSGRSCVRLVPRVSTHAHTKRAALGASHTHRAGNRLTSRVGGLEKGRKALSPSVSPLPVFDWIRAHQCSVQVRRRTEGWGGPRKG